MKIWVDDIRPAPKGYVWFRSVDYTIKALRRIIRKNGWREVR